MIVSHLRVVLRIRPLFLIWSGLSIYLWKLDASLGYWVGVGFWPRNNFNTMVTKALVDVFFVGWVQRIFSTSFWTALFLWVSILTSLHVLGILPPILNLSLPIWFIGSAILHSWHTIDICRFSSSGVFGNSGTDAYLIMESLLFMHLSPRLKAF